MRVGKMQLSEYIRSIAHQAGEEENMVLDIADEVEELEKELRNYRVDSLEEKAIENDTDITAERDA